DLLDLEIEPVAALNCNASSVDLSVSHPTYTDAVTYEWRLNGEVVGTGPTLPGITAVGTYVVAVTREDNGCPTLGQTEVVIDRDPPLATIAGPVIALNCHLPSVPLAVSANGPVSYAWSTTNGNLIGTLNTPTTEADRPGTYTVVVTDTLNGCTSTQTVMVVADGDQLATDAGEDQVLVCTGLGTVLNGNVSPNLSGAEGRWYGPDGVQFAEGFQAYAQAVGDYVFESVHPVSGCSAFDTVRVFSQAATEVSYEIIQPPCPEVGGRVIVRGVTGLNPPFTFSSPRGETDPLGSGVRGLPEGTHALIVTDALGCELRDTFQIFGSGEFTGFADDVTIRLGDEAELGVQTNRDNDALVQWTWSNLPDTLSCLDCPHPIVNTLESFIAVVSVTDTNGCVMEIRQNVFVEERSLVYVPTAFSPLNGDGVNDLITVFGDTEFVEIVSDFQIFDRWGNRVFGNTDFTVNDVTAGWNGQNRGKQSPPAVYAYTATVRYYDGTVETI
ncbi:MAG: gliding motility-associated C-terminal domain-containing protein, partial [Bacteroidota bacterium]